MSRQRQQRKKKERSRSRSRDRTKEQKQKKEHKHGKKHHHHRHEGRHEERWRNDSWGRDRSYNRHGYYDRNDERQKPWVKEVRVDGPKCFVLSDNAISGALKTVLLQSRQYPSRVEHSRLGQLKNKITPVERLWSSHIKQYLNISEFVQIFRFNKSLAYAPIEYGKSIIDYQEDNQRGQYNNLNQQAQIFSRAYFKLWEILEMGVLQAAKDQPLSIGCLAQGPGGFIHALVDYRLKQQRASTKIQPDTYNAITLKIDSSTRHAKDWSDQRGIKLFKRLRDIGQSINLSYGKTGTGNLLLPQNIQYFREEVGQKCQLVTGDGGIECIGDKEFQFQEIFNAKLFFGEIICALHIQQQEGKFILKIYDIGFELTRQLIILLALYYSKVTIVKPITSRPGNSEKYLLCEDFRGIREEELQQLKEVLRQWTAVEPNLSYFQNRQYVYSLFDFRDLPNYATVYDNIKTANEWFVEEQIQKIEEGLALCEEHRGSARSIEEKLKESRWKEQISFAYSWCKKYGLPTIEVEVEE